MKHKTSNDCIEAIKTFEGLRLEAYKPVPTEKHYTIGYGHYSDSIKKGARITRDYAEFLLRGDILKTERHINDLNLSIAPHQFDALVSFVFNLGIKNLVESTLLKKIRAKAPAEEIKAQFARWVYSNGKKLPGLVKRRAWEAEQWTKD